MTSSTERMRAKRERDKGLEKAKARGRALGTDEANRRGEEGEEREDRIARAERYAVWDYEGRPVTSTGIYVSPGRARHLAEGTTNGD